MIIQYFRHLSFLVIITSTLLLSSCVNQEQQIIALQTAYLQKEIDKKYNHFVFKNLNSIKSSDPQNRFSIYDELLEIISFFNNANFTNNDSFLYWKNALLSRINPNDTQFFFIKDPDFKHDISLSKLSETIQNTHKIEDLNYFYIQCKTLFTKLLIYSITDDNFEFDKYKNSPFMPKYLGNNLFALEYFVFPDSLTTYQFQILDVLENGKSFKTEQTHFYNIRNLYLINNMKSGNYKIKGKLLFLLENDIQKFPFELTTTIN